MHEDGFIGQGTIDSLEAAKVHTKKGKLNSFLNRVKDKYAPEKSVNID